MADYERSTMVNNVAPDAAFDYLSNPANMPSYIVGMTRAVPSGDGLNVSADVAGRGTEQGEAAFRADAGSRKLEWSRAGHDYRGELQVADAGGGSKITIKVHTHDDSDAEQTELSLQQTLANIQMALSELA
jgi:hypothetical protein